MEKDGKTAPLPEVTAKMASDYGEPIEDLRQGKQLYLIHCATCHPRVQPGEIDPEFWREVTPHMAVKAKLSLDDERKLLGYLMVAHAEVHGLNPGH